MLRSVGVEPTGERFSSILLDAAHNRAFNPMVNSRAIVPASLLTCASAEHGAEEMRALFSRLAGRRLEIDEAVFRSEHETGHRNRAIAWLMLNSGMIEPDPDRVLELYFQQCSVLVNCADLASMACTLETLGRQPLTGAQGFAAGVTWDVLSVKTTCGIYDYAGQWLYDVGLPANSAVSGMIMAVVPGQRGWRSIRRSSTGWAIPCAASRSAAASPETLGCTPAPACSMHTRRSGGSVERARSPAHRGRA